MDCFIVRFDLERLFVILDRLINISFNFISLCQTVICPNRIGIYQLSLIITEFDVFARLSTLLNEIFLIKCLLSSRFNTLSHGKLHHLCQGQ